MGFSSPEYWSGLPFPSPGKLSNPGIESTSPALQVDPLPLSHQEFSTPALQCLESVNPLLWDLSFALQDA